MGLKRKNKVNAEFNMSSLTDIIFLLLIFFMLTSSVISPNALNLKLPGKSELTSTISETPDILSITSRGKFVFNNKTVSKSTLAKKIRAGAKKYRSSKDYTVQIFPEKGAPTESVVYILDLGMKYDVNTVLALENTVN